MEYFMQVQFSSVAQSCLTLCNPMNRSTPGLPVHHHLPEFTQTHVHRVCDAIQPSHPLLSPSPPALNPPQHQSLFQWVNSSHEVATVQPIGTQKDALHYQSSVQFSHSVMSSSLRPHVLQHARLPYPSPTPGAYSNSYPLSQWCHPTFNLSQDQGLFKWVNSSHQVVKVLGFQLQHQSFQWIFRTDFL